jgi:hypothetical protein
MIHLRFFLYAAIVLFPTIAIGQQVPDSLKSVLKQSSPDELNYFAYAHNTCGIESSELNKVIEGVLIRSRVKPVNTAFGKLYLNAFVNCTESNSSGWRAFEVSINFARWSVKPAILYEPGYKTVGYDREATSILNYVKKHVEEAVTDYISVHLDL